jgi:DnaD/phage-associated family protein
VAREYFCAYHSYTENLETLNDAECGRLFRALLNYSKTGAISELRGNERFVFPSMKQQIDRDAEKYQAKCDKNRQSAEERWIRTHANACERMQTHANAYKEKKKEKEKEIISSPSLSPPSLRPQGNDDDDLISVVRLWEKASGRLVSPLQGEELQALLEEHTAESVCNAIRSASQHNAVNLAYIKAVLNGKPKQQASGEKEYSPEMQRWLRGEGV